VHAVLDRHGLGPPTPAAAPRRHGDRAVAADRSERALGADYKASSCSETAGTCLSADGHRLREPLPADVLKRSPRRRDIRLHRLRAHVQSVWAPARDSHRQPACPSRPRHALYGLSKLSVWWLRLGIQIERIQPAIRSKTVGTSGCTCAEERSDQAGRGQRVAAARPVRHFVAAVPGPAAAALGMRVPGRRYVAPARLSRPRGLACPSTMRPCCCKHVGARPAWSLLSSASGASARADRFAADGRLNALDLNPQSEPTRPTVCSSRRAQRGREGHAVVGANRVREPKRFERALEDGEGECLLRRGERFTRQQVAAREVGDRQRIAVPAVPSMNSPL